MKRLTVADLERTDWFKPLLDEIRAALERKSNQTHDQRPVLEAEVRRIDDQVRGWLLSLSKPDLPAAVRTCIEAEMAVSGERRNEHLRQLSSLHADKSALQTVVDPEQIVDCLNRLGEILANNNPSRANIELMQHIESIRCYPDGRVVVRTSKLGALADAHSLLRDQDTAPSKRKIADNVVAGKPRRLTMRKLRGEDADDEQVRAAADRATEVNRFAGLGPEWFWEDEFAIPPPPECWSKANALVVAQKRRETGWTYQKLADFFGVDSHTIGKAIHHALELDPSFGELPQKMPRAHWEDSHYEEVWSLFQQGMLKKELAKHFQKSAKLIQAALALAERRFGGRQAASNHD